MNIKFVKSFFFFAAMVGVWIFPAGAQDVADEKDPVFLSGQAALEDGLYDVAREKFEEYIEKSFFRNKRALGTLYLAQALYGQGKYHDVEQRLSENRSLYKGTDSEGGLVYWLARSIYEQKNYRKTLVTLDGFEKAFPGNSYERPAARLRVHAYLYSGQKDKALIAFSHFHRKYPTSPEAPENLLDWADVLMGIGQNDEGEARLRLILERYADSDAAHKAKLRLAQVHMKKMSMEEARRLLSELSADEKAPGDLRAAAWYALARVAETGGDLSGAYDALVEGEKRTRDFDLILEGRKHRAQLLTAMKKFEEATELLNKTVKDFAEQEGVGEIQLSLAHLYLSQKKFSTGLDAFQKYLEAFTSPEGEAQAFMGKGWCLWELKRYAEAASAFEKAYDRLKQPKEKEQALIKAADSHFANGQYKLAEEKYIRARGEFKNKLHYSEIQFQIAECRSRLGDFREAEKEYRIIQQQNADTPMAEKSLLRLASLQESQGRWEEAIQLYGRFMESYPKSSSLLEAMLGRGMARYRAGLFDKALEDFGLILDQYPASEMAEQAFYMRGWCSYLQGDSSNALKICLAFLENFPGSRWAPDVMFWIGEYHYNKGDFMEAETIFKELSEKFAQSEWADDALLWAGKAAYAQNEYRRAVTYFNNLAKIFSDSPKVPEARFAQGDALSELGEFSGAILAFEEVIKNFPDHYLADYAWGRKGDCQFTLGSDDAERYEEAVAAYREVVNSLKASTELKEQAEFKMGRCLEKMGRSQDAFTHYMNVVYGWWSARQLGEYRNVDWFTRAAFQAAALKENEKKWDEALKVYQRVVEADVPASADAQKKIKEIAIDSSPEIRH